MRIPLERQKALYERYAMQATYRLQKRIEQHREHIIALGADRAFGIGLDDYGDKSFWIPNGNLDAEAFAELADGTFYEHILIARQSGRLPNCRYENPRTG